MKTKCCGVEPIPGSGYLYVNSILSSPTNGKPLNKPTPIFICSKCYKPAEIEEKKDKGVNLNKEKLLERLKNEEWIEKKAKEIVEEIGYRIEGELLKIHIERAKNFICLLIEDCIAKEDRMVVQLLENDSRFKLKKGEIFEAQVYWLDPGKITLLKRLPDGFDPECNQYRGSVKILK